MTAFEFATANRILFGAGKLSELSTHVPDHVTRLLLVRGGSSEAIPRIREMFSIRKTQVVEFEVHGEPSVESVVEGMKAGRQCTWVIGLGGGSALDTGKAISALATNPGDPLDYLEVIGKGNPLTHTPMPYIAIPTTAGTGSEVTRNAVLASPEHGVKVSLRSPLMLPRIALIDPELTYTLSPAVTASTGLDALTQLIEPFVSNRANPMIDSFCREGIRLTARSLRAACRDGTDKEARSGMSLSSLLGGLALANAALGAVHGFAGPLGGMLGAPHGELCARLLPLVMEANIKALNRHQPGHAALDRYTEIAQLLTGDQSASAGDGVKWIGDLVEELRIPRLAAHGMSPPQIAIIAGKATQASSFKGNPVALSEKELEGILERAL